MSYCFCPICGVRHDPDVPCYDLTSQILKDVGIREQKQKPPGDFRSVARRADRSLIIILLIFAALAPLGMLMGAIIDGIKRMLN